MAEQQKTVTLTPPIVGIGASAGWLEAFEAFFRACPVDSGMAFVLVPHLAPDHHSLLSEILQRCTAMPVTEAVDLQPVQANHVYIIPPNREMAFCNGALELSEPSVARGQRLPIDGFLRSLAEDQAEKAIGIILSGTASDGTLGLRAILAVGGVCMVQEPDTARYDGMPQSAIVAGVATHILPVEKMPAMLGELIRQSAFRHQVPRILPSAALDALKQILLQVRSSTGHDFSLYKKSSLSRRIERRMFQHDIDDMAVYARFLKQNPGEVQRLFSELLIKVTQFFRDPKAFDLLKHEILPPMLLGKPENYVFRVWVAACASGEEAYSIAIVLRELMDETQKAFKVQIYATDLDENSIAEARVGHYPPNIAQNISPERLHRFFSQDKQAPSGYQIKKEIREMVVFAVHSAIKDPPFTQIDLLSCRNLLIYLEEEQQSRLILHFYYALKAGGVLLLSSSESLTEHPELFQVLNRKWSFYRVDRRGIAPHLPQSDHSPPIKQASRASAKNLLTKIKAASIADMSHHLLLQSYAPPSVTTDLAGNILYVYGDTQHYLRAPPGPVTANVLDMAVDGLQMDLRAALRGAAQGLPTRDRQVLLRGEGSHVAHFSVRLLPQSSKTNNGEHLLLISFQEGGAPDKTPSLNTRKHAASLSEQQRTAHLERELDYAKENLQATIEMQQTTNEELQSSNEEWQATNEELQSVNEEMATAKEELQSLNEEAIMVNTELNAKIEQLTDIQNDMKNLLDSVGSGILFLDQALIIRRYTHEAVKAYRLIPNDVGRSLSDIASNIEGADLLADLRQVLNTFIPIEREVCSVDGTCYLARSQPYRTLDNVMVGVVLILTNISALKQTRSLLRQREEQALALLNALPVGVLLQSPSAEILSSNPKALELLGLSEAQLLGKTSFDPQWNVIHEDGSDFPGPTHPVAQAIARVQPVRNVMMGVYRPAKQDRIWLRVNAVPLCEADGRVREVICTFADVTELRAAQQIRDTTLQTARLLAEGIVNENHDNPLPFLC
jgi:two-component system CheB/CheR fusion protein